MALASFKLSDAVLLLAEVMPESESWGCVQKTPTIHNPLTYHR